MFPILEIPKSAKSIHHNLTTKKPLLSPNMKGFATKCSRYWNAFLLDTLLFCTTKQFLTLNISASKNVPFKLWQNQHNYQTHTLIKQFRLRVTFNSLFEKSQRQCQKVGLSMTDMFVIDHKEKLSLINHKLVCDKTRTIFLCYLLQTLLLL